MDTEKAKRAIDSLVYYIKYYKNKLKYTNNIEFVEQLRELILTSNNLKEVYLQDIIKDIPVDKFYNILKSSLEKDRYYRYEIMANILSCGGSTV